LDLKKEARLKKKKEDEECAGYRRENILSHTGITSGCKDHHEAIKNRTGDKKVIINFQEEFLRHKRAVSGFKELKDLYGELDTHFSKFNFSRDNIFFLVKIFGNTFHLSIMEGPMVM
jgi:hypothetical protein